MPVRWQNRTIVGVIALQAHGKYGGHSQVGIAGLIIPIEMKSYDSLNISVSVNTTARATIT